MINLIDIKQPRDQANELRDRSWNKDLSIPTKNVLNIIDIIKAEGDTGIFKCVEKYYHVKLK